MSDALAAIEAGPPSAAILDVNLGGEQVYPVARALRERGIPFMFATGYGERRLPSEFEGERTLQKPYIPAIGRHAPERSAGRLVAKGALPHRSPASLVILWGGTEHGVAVTTGHHRDGSGDLAISPMEACTPLSSSTNAGMSAGLWMW